MKLKSVLAISNVFFIVVSLYAQDYITYRLERDSGLFRLTGFQQIADLKKNDIVVKTKNNTVEYEYEYEYEDKNENNIYSYRQINIMVEVITEKEEIGWVRAKDLSIIGSDKLPISLELFTDMENRILLPSYYFEILKAKNKEILKRYEPFWNNFETIRNRMDEPERDWYNHAGIMEMQLSTAYFAITGIPIMNYVYGKVIQVQESRILWECIDVNTRYQPSPLTDGLEKGKTYFFDLIVDGDFLDICLNEKFYLTFASVDRSFYDIVNEFLQKDIYPQDLSNITFPRRADKTHTVGTTCIVAESLRLRKEENTSSATLQIMQPGTQVQIQQLGKKQTIDGITANWVQVELEDKTKGWCFGGYLVEK